MHGTCGMRVPTCTAHLARATFAGDGEATDGSSSRASAPSHTERPAVAADGDGRECMAT